MVGGRPALSRLQAEPPLEVTQAHHPGSAGAFSDRIGARQACGAGLLVFVAASVACGLASSIVMLVGARCIQGAGAAAMLPATLALIREAYADPVQRGRAIALWSFGAAVASAAGPVVGGSLTLLTWRLIFINLPVGVVALLLLARVPRSPRRVVPFDWVGQLAAIVGMGALTDGLIEGGAMSFGTPLVVGALVAAVAALFIFLIAEARGSHPMVPLGMFRSRPVLVSVSVGFSFAAGFYGLVFLLSLYFQEVRSLSSAAAGLAFLPMTAVGTFMTPVAS